MDTFDKLDKVDLQILRTLQENARLTTKELAARVSLSSTPVFERLKRLENGGYIKKYIAVLDAEKLNQGFVVFCSVKLRRLNSCLLYTSLRWQFVGIRWSRILIRSWIIWMIYTIICLWSRIKKMYFRLLRKICS